jgi:hypothetical protein
MAADTFFLKGRVGEQRSPDNTEVSSRFERTGGLVTAAGRSPYGESASRGRIFHGNSVVGGNAFPIYSATALVFALWNPLGSGFNLELLKFSAAYVSGVGAAGSLGYNWKADAGAQAATGSPVAAFNHVAAGIVSGLLGNGPTSVAKFSNAATNTIVAAPTANFISGNHGQIVGTGTGATTTIPVQTTWQVIEDFIDGSIIIPPGVLFFPCGLVASVDLFSMKLTWQEVPIAA